MLPSLFLSSCISARKMLRTKILAISKFFVGQIIFKLFSMIKESFYAVFKVFLSYEVPRCIFFWKRCMVDPYWLEFAGVLFLSVADGPTQRCTEYFAKYIFLCMKDCST